MDEAGSAGHFRSNAVPATPVGPRGTSSELSPAARPLGLPERRRTYSAPARRRRLRTVRSTPSVLGVGLLPDSLTDRGNAKLFVRLYAQDYRHV
ncbi:hypothetical protein ACWEOY_31860, partial [Streptomyces globisporus]